MMSVYNLLKTRRTIRKFKQTPISLDILEHLVDVARLAPSGSNLQPLEFIIVHEPSLLSSVFSMTRWAGYIAPKGTPGEGERPVAYITVLLNRKIRPEGGEHDSGAAIMSMIIAAWEEGIGSCWIGSIQKSELRALLNIPDHLEVDSVLALGYPAEKPVVEPLRDSVKYWKDENGTLHVPKRALDQVLHWNRYGNQKR